MGPIQLVFFLVFVFWCSYMAMSVSVQCNGGFLLIGVILYVDLMRLSSGN